VPAVQTEPTVLLLLLLGEHEAWTRADLQRGIAGTRCNPTAVIDAVDVLFGQGLVHFTGEFVTPTRASA
jgi:hypothetical protein